MPVVTAYRLRRGFSVLAWVYVSIGVLDYWALPCRTSFRERYDAEVESIFFRGRTERSLGWNQPPNRQLGVRIWLLLLSWLDELDQGRQLTLGREPINRAATRRAASLGGAIEVAAGSQNRHGPGVGV